MADFQALRISPQTDGEGFVAEWTVTVAGHESWVNFEYDPDEHVTDWWVVSPDGRTGVMWLADLSLSVALVEASLRWLAIGKPALPLPVVQWAPDVEWGVLFGQVIEDGAELYGDRELFARQHAAAVGRPLAARRAPGAWTVVS